MARKTLKHVCVRCGKGVQYAHLVSHAKNRVNKIRKPNLKWVRVLVSGKEIRMRLCTKCLKMVERPGKVRDEGPKTIEDGETKVETKEG